MNESGDRLRNDLCVVVPCYNAGDRVRPVVERLRAIVEHVIVVDDGSTDGCALGLESTGARIVSLQPNRGKGFALLRGFQEALGINGVQYVGVVDADGQHDPVELPRLYDTAIAEKADLLVGSRRFDLADVPWRSWFGNRLTAFLTKLLYRRAVGDTQSGYRIHSRRLLEDLLAVIPGGRYETEMQILVFALRGDYRLVTAPVQTIYEVDNASSHFKKVRDSLRIYRVLLFSMRTKLK